MTYYDHAVLMAYRLGPWADKPISNRAEKRTFWQMLIRQGWL